MKQHKWHKEIENLQYEIAEMVSMLKGWSEAYPTSIFPEITQDDINFINSNNPNLSAKFFAHVGRHFIKKGFEPSIKLLEKIGENLDD